MTYRESIHSLRSAQKSSSGAPAYSRFVNRPLGRLFAAAAHTLGMTPNAVTGISAVFTFAGIATIALVPPSPISCVIVVALLVVGYALDSADGQLARLRGGGSAQGEWLDHTVDAVKMSSIHVAVLICWARSYDVDRAWLLAPLAFGLVSMTFFFGYIMTDLLRRAAQLKPRQLSDRSEERKMSPLYALLVLPSDYGLLMAIFLLLWLQQAFIAIYVVLLIINVPILAVALSRWYRSLAVV